MTVTVASIAWATFLITRAAIVELTSARVLEIVAALGARVQSHMLQAVPAVELTSMLVDESLVPGRAHSLARHFVAVLRANPSFSWASYSDEQGNFTGAYRTPTGEVHVSQTGIAGGRSEMRDYAVSERSVWSRPTYQENYGYDPRADLFYQEVRKSGRRTWVGPYVFFDEGVPGITCASPHFSSEGKLLGVFTVDFNLNFLSRFVAELHFGAHGRAFILTRNGLVIAHPTLRLVETTGKGAAGRLVEVADVSDPILPAFYAAMRQHDVPPGTQDRTRTGTQFIFEFAGQRFIAGSRVQEIDSGLAWIVAAVAPESDFTGVLARNRLATLIISVVALGVGVLLTLALARQISVPLSRLASQMAEIGNFHLTKRQPMKTIFKEVALMDESLLNMTGSLRSFSYYVPTDLVRAMLASGQEATLQGQTRALTVYFSDIAGFTSIAESMTPDELVRYLSRYLDEMTQIVAAHGGTVDKFIGDAIMAFWGAPAWVPDHAARACEAALRSQKKLAQLRATAETQWLMSLQARIGIATGEVLVGNIGSRERFNYTVMGDTVNLASRLESLNKHYGTAILLSEPTYEAARDKVLARPVDVVQVKGKHGGVKVYEPLCLASEDDREARELASIFSRGLDAYLARNFSDAAGFFESALELRRGDQPAALLLERSRRFLQEPPAADWDGIYVATEK
jgi:adenylate cyclase